MRATAQSRSTANKCVLRKTTQALRGVMTKLSPPTTAFAAAATLLLLLLSRTATAEFRMLDEADEEAPTKKSKRACIGEVCKPSKYNCDTRLLFWEKCTIDNSCADGITCMLEKDGQMRCNDLYTPQNGYVNCYQYNQTGCSCSSDCCNPNAVCVFDQSSSSVGTCRLPCEDDTFVDRDMCGTSSGLPPLPSGFWTTKKINGQWQFVNPDGTPTVLRGISVNGPEQTNAGSWLYWQDIKQAKVSQLQQIVDNLVAAMVEVWNINALRIPICVSAWEQDYHIFSVQGGLFYRDWIDMFVNACTKNGIVAIIDGHTWAVSEAVCTHPDQDMDGCFWKNCAEQDYYTSREGRCFQPGWNLNTMCWQCSGQPTINSAHKLRNQLAATWAKIATHYNQTGSVFLELFNEPYSMPCSRSWNGDNDWDIWTEFYDTVIRSVRDAGSEHVVIVAGYDYGYDFYSFQGPIVKPDDYLPWHSYTDNIAYAFHPYQHGSCCGSIAAKGSKGEWVDLSLEDPYQQAFCMYHPDCGVPYHSSNWDRVQASNSLLPINLKETTCSMKGIVWSVDNKLPPCTAVESTVCNINKCAGDRKICPLLGSDKCPSMIEDSDAELREKWSNPEMGGWSRHALPMRKHGPLIATEFGTYDCSSPFIRTFMKFNRLFGISYTGWVANPQNHNDVLTELGSCGHPAMFQPSGSSYQPCLDYNACKKLVQPLPFAAETIYHDIRGELF